MVMMPGALSPEHELFAANVASGMSQRKAAKAAGFHDQNGFRLMQMPEIRARIDELTSAPDEKVRARIDAEFAILLNRVSCAEDEEYDADKHLRVLMGFARYKGWIIDRKQVDRRSLNASVRLQRAELDSAIRADLERLAPGAAGALERLGRPAAADDLKAIAAGESVESVTVASPAKSPKRK